MVLSRGALATCSGIPFREDYERHGASGREECSAELKYIPGFFSEL